jgi:type IV secretion system protein VirB1
MSVEAAFDACRNLDGAARILAADYSRSKPGALTEQAALKTALSLYNTGDRGRGLRNGYIAKVAAAQRTVPELEADQNTDLPATAAIPPTWDVFAALEPVTAGFVLHPQKAGGLH